MKERRQWLRIACEIESSCKDLDANPSAAPTFALIKDISMGGVRLRLNHSIPIANRLQCYVSLPGHEEMELQLQPAWSSELPHLGQYEVGAHFVNMDEQAREAIQDFEYEALLNQGLIA